MNSDRTVLTDAMWARVEPLLPDKATNPGVPAADNRLFVEAMLCRFRMGSPWRDLPERFGSWNSVFRRFRRWALSGVFERVFNVLSEEFDLEHVFVDGTIVQAHQKASGARGALRPGDRAFEGPPDEQGRGRRGRARVPGTLRDPPRPGA